MEGETPKKNIDEILSSPEFRHFIYPEQFLKRRLKEEFFRTTRTGRPLVLIQIFFRQFDLINDWKQSDLALNAWKTCVLALLEEAKFIDPIGFLQGYGLGIILLDSDMKTLQKIERKLLRKLHEANLLGVLRLRPRKEIFRAFIHTGKFENVDPEEDAEIERFNKTCHPFFKLERLALENNVLSRTYKRTFRQCIKRTIDLSCALLAIVVLSPLLLACALAVKISDPSGPIIFKQTRVGKFGRHFTMYKFRSMYTDAEERKAELEKFNETSGPTFKMKNDPRIYPLGRILRKFSLDELPQLFNIVRGDMSIVGPRPPVPKEVQSYELWHNLRLSVVPGLTCLWQISGRSTISFEEWMRLDNKYIRKRNTRLDLSLIAKTFKVVLKGDGAY